MPFRSPFKSLSLNIVAIGVVYIVCLVCGAGLISSALTLTPNYTQTENAVIGPNPQAPEKKIQAISELKSLGDGFFTRTVTIDNTQFIQIAFPETARGSVHLLNVDVYESYVRQGLVKAFGCNSFGEKCLPEIKHNDTPPKVTVQIGVDTYSLYLLRDSDANDKIVGVIAVSLKGIQL